MATDRKNLLVIFHSASGNTQRMCEAVVAGITSDQTTAVDPSVKKALEANASDLSNASGVILLTPENFGYMSGALKYFFDRIYYPCLENTQGMPYALVVRAGNDGLGAVQSVERITTGLAWRAVAAPIVSKGEFDENILQTCHDLGATFAAGLDAGIF